MKNGSLVSIALDQFYFTLPIGNYRNETSGKRTIVLISGACTALPFTSRGGEKSIAERLSADGYDVIIVPLPGFTNRHTDLKNITWNERLETVATILRPIIRDRDVQLVSFSLGGFVSIELVSMIDPQCRYHNFAHPLVLFNPPFVLNDPWARALDFLHILRGAYRKNPSGRTRYSNRLLEVLLRMRYFGSLVPAASGYYNKIIKEPELAQELMISGPMWYRRWPVEAVVEYLVLIPEIRRKLRAISAPIRIVDAELDKLVVPRIPASELFGEHKGVRQEVETLPKAGHFWLPLNAEKAVERILAPM